MTSLARLAVLLLLLLPAAAQAQPASEAAASSARISYLELPAGTPVHFVTVGELSSKRQVKGDPIALKTDGDTIVNGRILIPANSAAVGEISDSHGTGGLGVSGRLYIAPLYMSLNGVPVRFTGLRARNKETGADTVIGTYLLGAFISGKTAVIPSGTRIEGFVLHSVSVPAITP